MLQSVQRRIQYDNCLQGSGGEINCPPLDKMCLHIYGQESFALLSVSYLQFINSSKTKKCTQTQ